GSEKIIFEKDEEISKLKQILEEKEKILTSLFIVCEQQKIDLKTLKEHNQQSVPFPNEIIEAFYMSTPNKDGSFENSKRTSTFVPASSLYKFEVISHRKARFEFISEKQNILDAKYQSEILLEPVCEIENKNQKEIRSIESIKPGIAELIGTHW